MGVEPKLGVKPPKWMVKIMENPIKIDDLRVFPYFWKHPYSSPNNLRFLSILFPFRPTRCCQLSLTMPHILLMSEVGVPNKGGPGDGDLCLQAAGKNALMPKMYKEKHEKPTNVNQLNDKQLGKSHLFGTTKII